MSKSENKKYFLKFRMDGALFTRHIETESIFTLSKYLSREYKKLLDIKFLTIKNHW